MFSFISGLTAPQVRVLSHETFEVECADDQVALRRAEFLCGDVGRQASRIIKQQTEDDNQQRTMFLDRLRTDNPGDTRLRNLNGSYGESLYRAHCREKGATKRKCSSLSDKLAEMHLAQLKH